MWGCAKPSIMWSWYTLFWQQDCAVILLPPHNLSWHLVLIDTSLVRAIALKRATSITPRLAANAVQDLLWDSVKHRYDIEYTKCLVDYHSLSSNPCRTRLSCVLWYYGFGGARVIHCRWLGTHYKVVWPTLSVFTWIICTPSFRIMAFTTMKRHQTCLKVTRQVGICYRDSIIHAPLSQSLRL